MRPQHHQLCRINGSLSSRMKDLHCLHHLSHARTEKMWNIWVRSRNCGCLVIWFCYQLVVKPGNKTATVSWPDPYTENNVWVGVVNWLRNFGVYYPSCDWAQEQFITGGHTLFYFLHDMIVRPWITIEHMTFTVHTLILCFTWYVYLLMMTSQSIVQGIVGSINCDAGTRKMISNSFDITFIYTVQET